MEMMDVVDDNDVVVGKASQKEVYEKFLTHRITHVLVFNRKGEMALQLRSKAKSFMPGFWSTTAGGHVQQGETYEQAALREMKEEIGIEPNLSFLSKDLYLDWTRENKLKKFLGTFKATSEVSFKTNPEVERIEFFSLDKIREMVGAGKKFHPELLFLLEKHFGINKVKHIRN